MIAMTRTEFNEWWELFATIFPSTGNWVAENGGTRLLQVWCEQFQSIRLADALQASRMMLSGAADKPRAYEREDTPAFLLRAVRALEQERAIARQNAEVLQVHPSAGRFPAGKMFRRLLELQERHGHEQAMEILRQEFAQ